MKILLVEDEQGILEIAALALEHMGFQVTAVDDGCKALHELDQNQFDILMTDHNIPGPKGDALAMVAKEKGMKTVSISAEPRTGYDLQIQKPFGLSELESKLMPVVKSWGINSHS